MSADAELELIGLVLIAFGVGVPVLLWTLGDARVSRSDHPGAPGGGPSCLIDGELVGRVLEINIDTVHCELATHLVRATDPSPDEKPQGESAPERAPDGEPAAGSAPITARSSDHVLSPDGHCIEGRCAECGAPVIVARMTAEMLKDWPAR